MSDVVSSEELKEVYKFAQENSGKVMLAQLLEPPFSFENKKAQNVLSKLIQNRLAYAIPNATSANDIGIFVRNQEIAIKLKSITSPETYAVFQMVEQSGNQGISARDLTRVINDKLRKNGRPPMQGPVITRSLKTLETDKLIKSIKSVRDNGRKLFILYNLDGDRAVVGGVFYKNGEFNVDLVDEYRNKILSYLSAQTHHTPRAQLYQYIYSTGSSEAGVRLGEKELEKVVDSLVLDNLVVQMIHPYTGDTTLAAAKWPSFEDLERLPCASCPLQHVCEIEEVDHFDSLVLRRKNLKAKDMSKLGGHPGKVGPDNYISELSSKVTPSTCPYYNQWLKLPFLPWVLPPDAQPTQTEQ